MEEVAEKQPVAWVVLLWLLLRLLSYIAVALLPAALLWLRDRLRRHSSACVLVLGDLGRSPRMQYHVLSLAESFPPWMCCQRGCVGVLRTVIVPVRLNPFPSPASAPICM